MRIWMPYPETGGGADLYISRLARGLRALGHEVAVTRFAHLWQYFPWRLGLIRSPAGVDIAIGATGWAFPLRRHAQKLVVVEHHCVNDPVMAGFRNVLQALYHEGLLRAFTRRSLRNAAAIVCVSDYTARSLTSIHPGTHPDVIRNGIETDFFCPAQQPESPSEGRPFRLLFVGNLIRRKGALLELLVK